MQDVEKIKQRINIVDLISETVALKKTGRNFKALCPFHNEKTPSFIVSAERQIWRCFGCGKGGDIFSFIMELEQLEFPEALKILADRAGVKLESSPVKSPNVKIKERLLSLHHLAAEFYQYLLQKHSMGERARKYLKNRGISQGVTTTFGLGFAPSSWDNLTRFLNKKGFTSQEMILSGLGIKGQRGVYDRFRGRIMFPLKNHLGQTIAFAGRVLDPEAKEAKYVNSPETPLYIKGETLFGINVTKDAIRKSGSALVVEGEFDAISSYQVGVANVVAIKGSALTEAQVRLLKRFTERIILALDADVAGEAATRRGIEIADGAGLDIRVIDIPLGKDPDEAAREGKGVWKKAVAEAVGVYDFLIASTVKRFDANSAYGKKKISEELLPILAKINNTIVQAHYLKLLAGKLAVTEEKINEALKKVKLLPQGAGFAQPAQVKTVKDRDELLEEHLLALVLQSENLHQALDQVVQKIDPSDLLNHKIKRIFIELVDFSADQPLTNLNDFVKIVPSELVDTINHLSLTDLSIFVPSQAWQQELEKTTNLTKIELLRRKIQVLTTKISQTEKSGDEAKLTDLKNELVLMTTDLKQLNRQISILANSRYNIPI